MALAERKLWIAKHPNLPPTNPHQPALNCAVFTRKPVNCQPQQSFRATNHGRIQRKYTHPSPHDLREKNVTIETTDQ
jgi:hypothetical protein